MEFDEENFSVTLSIASTYASASVDVAMPQSVAIAAYAIVATEFVINFLLIFVSALTIHLILRTSVLHRNLKCILLCHSGVLLLNGLIKAAFTTPMKLLINDIFWLERENTVTSILIKAIVYVRIVLYCVLVLERTLATVYARCYEHRNWNRFTYAWLCAMILFVAGNFYLQKGQPDKVSGISPVVIGITTGLICGEILIFFVLWHYNKKKFQHFAQQIPTNNCSSSNGAKVHQQQKYDLAERYQYLENMRTSLQLGPIMLLYLLNSLNSSFLSSFFSSGKLVDDDPVYSDELVVMCSILFGSLCNLLIQVTTICLHPILKRNCLSCLRRLSASAHPTVCNNRRSHRRPAGVRRESKATEVVGRRQPAGTRKNTFAFWPNFGIDGVDNVLIGAQLFLRNNFKFDLETKAFL